VCCSACCLGVARHKLPSMGASAPVRRSMDRTTQSPTVWGRFVDRICFIALATLTCPRGKARPLRGQRALQISSRGSRAGSRRLSMELFARRFLGRISTCSIPAVSCLDRMPAWMSAGRFMPAQPTIYAWQMGHVLLHGWARSVPSVWPHRWPSGF
jgi:hypothetical protein